MASVRHLNLFPWCPYTEEAASVELSVSKVLALAAWWRVRKWKFSIEYSGSFTEDGTVFDHGSLADNYILQRGQRIINDPEFPSNTQNDNVQTETDLVCDYEGAAETLYQSFGNSTPYGAFSFEFRVMLGATPVHAVNGELFAFACYFHMSPVLTGGSLGSDIENGPNLTNVGTFTLSLLGESITKPINLIRDRPELGGANYSCNATIEAHEYWPYDPNDGKGPIYDKDTGERIRFDV